MIRMIKVTKIGRERHEMDDLEQVHDTVETSPMIVNVDQIREFYPRVNGKPGTRIVFLNGSGWPVTESFAEVESMVNGTRN